MKKTLMVLSFALCASFAFAQVKTAESISMHQKNLVAPKAVAEQQSNYKASIFTKDDEIVHTWDFSANNDGYTVGKMTSATTIDGQQFVAHTGNEAFAQWARIPGTDSASVASLEQVYSGILAYYGNRYHLWVIFTGVMDSNYCSAADGFMLVSMRGATGSANYNSYIQLDPQNIAAAGVYDVKFFQNYRKYYDYCYLDYSTDNGTTWHTMEINETGVDIAVNEETTNYYSVTLPDAARSANTILRIRHYSDAYSYQGGWLGHGYLWMIDDVQIIKGQRNRWKGYDQFYSEGAYQLMPQGLDLPLFWYSNVTNNGAIAQNNTQVKMYNFNSNGDSSEIGSYTIGNLNAGADVHVMYDPMGWAPDSLGHEGWYAYSSGRPTGTGRGLATDNAGEYTVGANVVSDSNALRWKRILYTVNEDVDHGYGVWGHDNGILTNRSAYTFGHTDDGAYVTDESSDFMNVGYMVNLRYTTGDTIPLDENGERWVIRGVQYVASTTPSKMSGTNHIAPYLAQDVYSEANPGSVSFSSLTTGVGIVTIDDSHNNDSTVLIQEGGWMKFGDYKVINVEFPMQPELTPYTSYRVGYQLAQDGLFCLAKSSRNSYIVPSDSTTTGYKVQYFSEDSTIAKYGTSFITANSLPNTYDVLVKDNSGSLNWAANTNYYPAIRLLVGPRVEYTQYQVTSTCQYEEGDTANCGIYNPDGQYACDSVFSFAEGSSFKYIIGVADNYMAEVTIDGEPVNYQNLEAYYNSNIGVTYYYYPINNIQANHTLNARFAFGSIDRVAANVKMNLQPNPASSQVKLSIEGVNGMVNCSLVDMSGRVVYNANINAEQAETINVSNLAKGAYFVRITNNDFTKVEKLIVR